MTSQTITNLQTGRRPEAGEFQFLLPDRVDDQTRETILAWYEKIILTLISDYEKFTYDKYVARDRATMRSHQNRLAEGSPAKSVADSIAKYFSALLDYDNEGGRARGVLDRITDDALHASLREQLVRKIDERHREGNNRLIESLHRRFPIEATGIKTLRTHIQSKGKGQVPAIEGAPLAGQIQEIKVPNPIPATSQFDKPRGMRTLEEIMAEKEERVLEPAQPKAPPAPIKVAVSDGKEPIAPPLKPVKSDVPLLEEGFPYGGIAPLDDGSAKLPSAVQGFEKEDQEPPIAGAVQGVIPKKDMIEPGPTDRTKPAVPIAQPLTIPQPTADEPALETPAFKTPALVQEPVLEAKLPVQPIKPVESANLPESAPKKWTLESLRTQLNNDGWRLEIDYDTSLNNWLLPPNYADANIKIKAISNIPENNSFTAIVEKDSLKELGDNSFEIEIYPAAITDGELTAKGRFAKEAGDALNDRIEFEKEAEARADTPGSLIVRIDDGRLAALQKVEFDDAGQPITYVFSEPAAEEKAVAPESFELDWESLCSTAIDWYVKGVNGGTPAKTADQGAAVSPPAALQPNTEANQPKPGLINKIGGYFGLGGKRELDSGQLAALHDQRYQMSDETKV